MIGYLRAKSSDDENSSVQTLYKLVNDQVEALEFVVTSKFKYISKRLMDMKLKDNILVAGISRGNEMIVPKGHDTLELNDHIIIIAKSSKIKNLNDIIGE